ncbi:MAG TPA: hypothetical protein VLF14_07040 [Candidatus Binatia bacterium]|nr:hypothetical protein [Candidatus Binatia bacterium]
MARHQRILALHDGTVGALVTAETNGLIKSGTVARIDVKRAKPPAATARLN